jgi:hypothetical protein
MFSNSFDVMLKIKKNILIYFQVKSTFQNYYTSQHQINTREYN